MNDENEVERLLIPRKRSIKFRFWTGTMIEPWEHAESWESLGFYLNSGDGYTPMQFTGLLDIKGNEIYEGDIVSYGKKMYEVAISFNGFYLQGYKLWNGKFRPSFRYAMSLITKPFKRGERGESGGIVEDAEVIGNIYENPELVQNLDVSRN